MAGSDRAGRVFSNLDKEKLLRTFSAAFLQAVYCFSGLLGGRLTVQSAGVHGAPP